MDDNIIFELTDELTVKPLADTEKRFAFDQSSSISSYTGLIGTLRGHFDRGDLVSSWKTFDRELDEDNFREAGAFVLTILRTGMNVLSNPDGLKKFCFENPDCCIGGDWYGLRIDTTDYTFMVKLFAGENEQNVCAFAYERCTLERYIRKSREGIRFITPNYEDRFRIPDGDSIRIRRSDGTSADKQCRYIDPYHMEVGGSAYHICEFAERMERCGNKVIPLRSALPDVCYSVLSESPEIIILHKGESGYYRSDVQAADRDESRALADELNARMGVTKPQEMAMTVGSMFGWDTKGADPATYDASGRPTRKQSRGAR